MNGLLMKYFVLNPSKKDAYGKASLKAMKAYAMAIFEENEELARDLVKWVESIDDLDAIEATVVKKKKK